VIPTIAKTLEVRESAERLTLLDTLNAYLCTRYVLLLLDNYEHLLSSALQIAELLEACPHAKILVTSRSPLRIRAERILDVPPLSIPPAQKHLSREQLFQYSAFQLFVQRAQSVKMDFQVTDENAQAVRDICHKLDGLPLAIELAAAWIKILTPQALLTRLEKRFLILRGGTRDLPERQQTMYKAIDWSYNLLSEKDKCLLQYLSVFAGGWTFESAETVCSNGVLCSMDIFDGVETLMSNNLLKPPEEVGKELRMKQFEAIREFAHDHLLLSEESEAVHLRYMQYFLSLAEQAEDELVQSSQQVWNKRISVELDNFRAVMSWAIEHNKNEVALQITNALWRFWWSHGYWSENLQWLTASLNGSGPVSNELKARALTQAGWLYRHMGYFAQAISMLQESLMLWKHANHPAGLAMTLTCLGASALGQGDTEQAMTYLEQAYQLSENQDSMLVKYVVKEYLGHIASRRGDVQSAIERYNESLAMAELVNDDSHIAKILNALGDEYVIDGKYDQAEECFSRAAMICNKLGNRIVGAYIMGNRGIIAMKRGDYSAAYNLLSKSISEVQELGDKVRAILCLGHFAYIAKEQQQLDRAVNILGASDKLRKAIGLTLSQPMEADFKTIVAYLINQLGKDAFITAWTNGSSMTYDQAVAYALQQES
jgi:predicted ATPase/Tfp pilus assembly protein PilF